MEQKKRIIINNNEMLFIYCKESDEEVQISVNNNELYVEDTPFREIIDTAIQYLAVANPKCKKIHGIDAKVYIDNFCEKYYPSELDEED